MLMRPNTKTTSALVALALTCSPALAQDLSSNVSCLSGSIEPYDYAELTSNFRETLWDTKAGVKLIASQDQVILKVLDLAGTSVCADEADLTGQCTFRLRTEDNFTIIVDNSTRATVTTFRLCAF